MRHKNTVGEQVKQLFCNFFKQRGFTDHFIAYSRKFSNIQRYVLFWVYQCFPAVCYLCSVVNDHCNFGNPASACITSRGFYIYYGVFHLLHLLAPSIYLFCAKRTLIGLKSDPAYSSSFSLLP